MISITITFLVPHWSMHKKVHFQCIGIGEDRCEAHNACMFSAQRGLNMHYDDIRAQEAKDFCHVAHLLAFEPNREQLTIGNITAIVNNI